MNFNRLVQLVEAKKPVVETAEQLYEKAKKLKKRLPASEEHVIAQDPEWAFPYAENVLHRRFILGESPLIPTDMEEYLNYLSSINLV